MEYYGIAVVQRGHIGGKNPKGMHLHIIHFEKYELRKGIRSAAQSTEESGISIYEIFLAKDFSEDEDSKFDTVLKAISKRFKTNQVTVHVSGRSYNYAHL